MHNNEHCQRIRLGKRKQLREKIKQKSVHRAAIDPLNKRPLTVTSCLQRAKCLNL